MKKLLVIITLPLLFTALFTPVFVSGAGLGDAQGQLETAGGIAYGADAETEFESVLGNLINTLLSITGIVFLLLMIYGGYLWMTARENQDQAKKAKDVITAAFIGIVIVVLAYGITFFVIEQLLSPSGAGSGFKESPFEE